MNRVKIFIKIGFLAFLVFFVNVFSVEAQRKRQPVKKPTTRANTAANSVAEIKEGANKVSIQIKNLSKFLYLLGTIAQGIEDLDNDPRASAAAKDKNTRNKQSVISTIRNLRVGLAALEIEFRTKNSLKSFNTKIQGISDLCGQSEDLAISGKFVESGRPLLIIVEKLSDTLAAMP